MHDTLDEALTHGRGNERPFRCPEHQDTVASASVNVLKGLWFCFGCQARGRVDPGKRAAPSVAELEAMMAPDKAVRSYPEAYLELFCEHEDLYWNTRHPAWVSHQLGMGSDPFTGQATFAVHSPSGTLAGIGRRRTDGQEGPRYIYPARWSSARSLGGTMGRYPTLPVLCLVEGMADAAAVWSTGCPGIAVYGAGLHVPQLELLARYNPKLVLLGFDTDEAGERAVSAAFKQLGRRYQLKRVKWSKDDPSATPMNMRARLLADAVAGTAYSDSPAQWAVHRADQIEAYSRHMKEDHAA